MAFGAPFPGGSKVIGTFLGSVSTGTTTDPMYVGTFGTPADDRYILAIVATNTTGGFNSCTIGGVVATQLFTAVNGTVQLAFYIAAVPTGTTGTVHASLNLTNTNTGISVYSITGTSAPFAATNVGTGMISIPAESMAIGANYAFKNPGGPPVVSWTGLTLDNNESLGTTFTLSTASAEVDAATTLNITTSGGTQDAIGVAVWSP